MALAVEVVTHLEVGDLVVSARRPQHLDGAFLLGNGVVKLPGLGIGGGKGVADSRVVNQTHRFAGQADGFVAVS